MKNHKLVSESLDQFIGSKLDEGISDRFKSGMEKTRAAIKTTLKKISGAYQAMFGKERLIAILPVNIALMFKHRTLGKNAYVVPNKNSISLEPSLAKFTPNAVLSAMKAEAKREKEEFNRKFPTVESYMAYYKNRPVMESAGKRSGRVINEGTEAFKHFDKNVPNANTARLHREIYKQMMKPTGDPLMIWGAPGIGKTGIVQEILKSRTKSGTLIFLDAQFMTPEAWFMPYISHEGGETKYVDLPKGKLPLYLPAKKDDPDKIQKDKEADDKVNDGDGGIIFFDELSRASIEVQGSCLQLMGNRRLEDFVLGSKWVVIAASNRKTDESDPQAIKFSSTLGNRFLQINYVPEWKEWKAWAEQANVNSAILHFLEFNHERWWYTKNNDDEDQAIFASPRTWEKASNSLSLEMAACEELGVPCTRVDKLAAIASAVGLDVAEQIITFMYITDKYPMTEIQNIWVEPEKGPVLEKGGKSKTTVVMTEAIAIAMIAIDLKKKVKELNPKEFINFAKWLISIDSAPAAVYAFKMLLDQHPYMHAELGDYKPGELEKYKKGTDMLTHHYGTSWGGSEQA